MDERTRRIVETAITLAERDGFEAVRLRDIAQMADVALGTVYRRFASKEDILVAVLEYEALALQGAVDPTSFSGGTPFLRVVTMFEVLTRMFLARPNLARAVLRAVSSGVPEITEKVSGFHDMTTLVVIGALRGIDNEAYPGSAHEEQLAALLQQIWFAELVGWAGGLATMDRMIANMRAAAKLLLAGAAKLEEE
jgi:TetR/AcrR family transcriptional regulator, cholesterol catabolism regulator